MYRTARLEAEARLRAAHAALAERDRLAKRKLGVETDLSELELTTKRLERIADRERRDVARYESGVWATLYGLVGNRVDRLAKEQREAEAAEAEYDEALERRRRLADELESINRRLDELRAAHDELEVLRNRHEAAILAGDDPTAKELGAIVEELGRLDDETRALDAAAVAGSRAHSAMSRLLEALRVARAWGAADMWSTPISKGQKIDEAREIAADAQDSSEAFCDLLSDLDIELEVFGHMIHPATLDTALEECHVALAGIGRCIDELRERKATCATRIDELTGMRLALVDG